MFKLIATVYFLMNGQPVGDPAKMTNKIEFATLEECAEAKDTEIIQASLGQLNASIDAATPSGGSHTTTVGCERVEDGSI